MIEVSGFEVGGGRAKRTAVSVAREKETWCEATETQEPEEDPPETWSLEKTEAGWP